MFGTSGFNRGTDADLTKALRRVYRGLAVFKFQRKPLARASKCTINIVKTETHSRWNR